MKWSNASCATCDGKLQVKHYHIAIKVVMFGLNANGKRANKKVRLVLKRW